jgi:hypothetical protein
LSWWRHKPSSLACLTLTTRGGATGATGQHHKVAARSHCRCRSGRLAAAAAQARFVVDLLGVEVKDKRGRRQQGNRATGAQNLCALREGDWCDDFGDRCAGSSRMVSCFSLRLGCPRFAYLLDYLSVSLQLLGAFCLVCSQSQIPFFCLFVSQTPGELPASFHHFGGGAPPIVRHTYDTSNSDFVHHTRRIKQKHNNTV